MRQHGSKTQLQKGLLYNWVLEELSPKYENNRASLEQKAFEGRTKGTCVHVRAALGCILQYMRQDLPPYEEHAFLQLCYSVISQGCHHAAYAQT